LHSLPSYEKITGMRISDLRFLLALSLPLSAVVGVLMVPQLSALITLLFWASIVLLDLFLPGGKKSPVALAVPADMAYFSWILRAFVPLQLALIGLGAYAAAQGDWLTALGLAFSVGYITGAQGITFAHELGHSKSKIDRFCAWVLMTSVCYGHFMVEHYRGHHSRAATHDDPASARYGESLYRFLPRTLWGSLVSGWRLEGQRIQQMKSSWVRSPLLWSAIASLMLIMLPAIYFNAQAAIKYVVFFVGQSCMAFLLLEIVNYIEHYGLQRNTDGGKREAFGMMHAWNADHLVTNTLLANLQRHSDHHMHAWKPYATLQALPGPQLPTGYAGCLMLAMVPPLWFKLMHKRISALGSSNAMVMPTASST
jgi:alkane 1-monooxygenase